MTFSLYINYLINIFYNKNNKFYHYNAKTFFGVCRRNIEDVLGCKVFENLNFSLLLKKTALFQTVRTMNLIEWKGIP